MSNRLVNNNASHSLLIVEDDKENLFFLKDVLKN